MQGWGLERKRRKDDGKESIVSTFKFEPFFSF